LAEALARIELEDSDDALMARVAQRDALAFRLIVERHLTSLHRLAYRMLGDAAGAEDVAQDALLRLWDHAGRWQSGGAGIGAWLRRVATNVCLDRLRRQKFSGGNEIPDRADDAPLADEQMEEDQMRQATRHCMGQLPDRQRAAIVLTYYEDRPNAEAAAVLDLNIKAFESLLVRARQTLRRIFEEKGLVPDAFGKAGR
jgi:RNA polymerase sigma-70 factor (ECF subfamily)